MIISHRHRLLFVEVPHSASSAVARELQANYGGEAILHKHANLSQFHAWAGGRYRDYFSVASIRNPLDSTVTEYFKYRTNHLEAYTDPGRRVENGGWVTPAQRERFRFVHEKNADFADYFARYYRSVHHNWVLIGHFDKVLKFERIGEEFEKLLRMRGIEPARALPMFNPTQREQGFADRYPAWIRPQAMAVMGPFMARWGYDFPPEWGPVRIPVANRLKFHAVELAAGWVARRLPLDPANPGLRRIKGLIYPSRR